LVSLYSSLPPEDFEAHKAALAQAEQAKAGPAAPGASAPPPAAPGSAGGPPMPPAMKSESVQVKNLEKQIQELKKSLGEVTQVADSLAKLATVPQRKATTGVTFIPYQPMKKKEDSVKSYKDMTESEFRKALSEKASSASLKKNERQMINKYCTGSVNRDAVAFLFEKESK
jgi:hypothetical protein